MGIGHTGNPSDHKHTAHRLQSFTPDSVVRWSILLNRTLLELRSELEHWSAFFRTNYCHDASSSSRRDNSTHRAAILLRHADPGEPFPASLLRHRVRIRSRSYDSVFPRHHSRFLSHAREKKKSHKKRKFSSTSSPSHRFSFSSFR